MKAVGVRGRRCPNCIAETALVRLDRTPRAEHKYAIYDHRAVAEQLEEREAIMLASLLKIADMRSPRVCARHVGGAS